MMNCWWEHQLLSPQWIQENGKRSWVVVRLNVSIAPYWAEQYSSPSGLWFFREILFLSKDSEVHGIGRMWCPIRARVLPLLSSLVLPRGPLLGQLLQARGSVEIRLLERKQLVERRAQYWESSTSVLRTRRELHAGTGRTRLMCLTEELFR